eukprot:SAG31_NODE_6059_length_2189_cov_2.629665_1_plen_148_part_00
MAGRDKRRETRKGGAQRAESMQATNNPLNDFHSRSLPASPPTASITRTVSKGKMTIFVAMLASAPERNSASTCLLSSAMEITAACADTTSACRDTTSTESAAACARSAFDGMDGRDHLHLNLDFRLKTVYITGLNEGKPKKVPLRSL